MDATDNEQTVLNIIAVAGEAKSHCYRAIHEIAAGRPAEAERCLKTAEQLLQEVHRVHLGLLGGGIPGDPRLLFLLVHAEDIFMTTMTEKELLKNLIRTGLLRPPKPADK